MAKRSKKTLMDSLKGIVVSKPPASKGRVRKAAKRKADKAAKLQRRDLLSPFVVATLDLDLLIDPPPGRARPIPNELPAGRVLVSQKNGIKCLLLQTLDKVDNQQLRDICARKLTEEQAIYLPMGRQILRDELLHMGKRVTIKLRKGTLFLSSVDGQPNGYLLEPLQLPIRKELLQNYQYLAVTEQIASRYLQNLVDIPESFAIIKEDVFYDDSEQARIVEKGTLVISRNGALTGLMLDDLNLPIKGEQLNDLDELFQLQATYTRLPIETLIQRAAQSGNEIEIERGTFLFSPHGKVYFVWREGLQASEQQLIVWSKQSTINAAGILEVSLVKGNVIGGPGEVITQDEINYLRDVFRQAGTTNIRNQTLLLDRNVFYKFLIDMPYAQTGKFRAYLATGGVIILNSFRKGTFSVEMGGKSAGQAMEITDLDIGAVRKHLQPTGRILIKIGSHLRIRDEREGDWIYRVTTNLFYPYDTFTRPYMEEFIPENLAFDHRSEKMSTLIGPQENPHEEDLGATGEPLADLRALINNEIGKERIVFVLDNTLFHWHGRLYRVNEELSFRPGMTEQILDADLEALEAEWKIHPVVEDAEDDEEYPQEFEEEDDLADLPLDTGSLR